MQKGREKELNISGFKKSEGYEVKKKKENDEDGMLSLLLKTALVAVVALSIFVLRSINSGATENVIAGVKGENAKIHEEDIGKLKFVEGDAVSVTSSNAGFVFPADGKITAKFGEDGATGLEITAKKGNSVVNAVEGTVYKIEKQNQGAIVTVKVSKELEVSYYNVEPEVQEGDKLKCGDKIGTLSQDALLVEVYKNAKKIDPLELINKK